MQSKLSSPAGLNPMGSGPKIFRNTTPFLIVGILAGLFFKNFSYFPVHDREFMKSVGWSWLFAGLLSYGVAVKQFLKGFSGGNLITSGVFRFSRNPIYSSWILFILPALAMISNNWIFLVASLAMYISLCYYIKEEEDALEKAFGEIYSDYCERTGRLISIPGLRKSSGKSFKN